MSGNSQEVDGWGYGWGGRLASGHQDTSKVNLKETAAEYALEGAILLPKRVFGHISLETYLNSPKSEACANDVDGRWETAEAGGKLRHQRQGTGRERPRSTGELKH